METIDINKDVEILLIEDDPKQAAQMIKTIEEHPITKTFLWLEDGAQAMKYLMGRGIFTGRDVKNTPKIIFLDVKIPSKNGLEVLFEIRNTPNLKDIPVYLMCSTEKQLEWIKSYKPKIDNFFLKPLDSLGLANIINKFN